MLAHTKKHHTKSGLDFSEDFAYGCGVMAIIYNSLRPGP